MSRPLCELVTASLFLLFGTAAQAESQAAAPVGKRRMVGVVRDTGGVALEGVTVIIPGTVVRTDARGTFAIDTPDLDTVTIGFRHLGFEPAEALLTSRGRLWDTVVVRLDPTAQRLDYIKVADTRTRASLAMRSFEERRARGLGTFITRSEIVERGSSRLSDLLRTKRGVNVERGRVRFVAFTGTRGTTCVPDLWLDGMRTRGMEVDELPPNTVEMIELYPNFSTVPIEFQSYGSNSTPCGTIVVWTRIPNGRSP